MRSAEGLRAQKMTTTLLLTRKPDALFQSPLFKTQYGRFGTLIVLQGGEVTSVRASAESASAAGPGTIPVPAGVLETTTSDGSGVQEVKRYTTIERMHGYVQLKPQEYNGKVYKQGPYGITYEPKNPVVAELKGTGGRCFRVHGGTSAQERGILIHEAPHVGFLIGCIGPRKYKDRNAGFTASAHSAMEELFGIRPRPSALFVLDW
jgi:hypothetical protein